MVNCYVFCHNINLYIKLEESIIKHFQLKITSEKLLVAEIIF